MSCHVLALHQFTAGSSWDVQITGCGDICNGSGRSRGVWYGISAT